MKYIVILFLFIGLNLYSLDLDNSNFIKNENNTEQQINYEFGIVLGNPSALNLNLIYHLDKFIIKSSGNYLGSLYGVQFDLGYKIYQTNTTYHAFTIAGGFSRYPKNNNIFNTNENGAKYGYGSLNYLLSYNGLFMSLGVSTGNSSLKSPRASIQIGYNIQFR